MIMAAVIPAVWNSLGVEAGGRFLRRVFDGYNEITLGVLLFLFGMVGVRFVQCQHSVELLFPITRLELLLLGAMALVTILIVWVLGPQAIALQEQAFEATTELGKKRAYDHFFRLHNIVRALHLINLALAVGLFFSKLRKGLAVRSNP